MSEPEDPEVLAMRERAERVMAARAKKRDEAARAEEAAPPPKKAGRRWYQWVIDGALFVMVAYLIKTRFLDKQAEPAPTPPAARASASAAPSVRTLASAEVRAAPATSESVVETVAPETALEVLELSSAGFIKVKTPSGKSGWVPVTAIATTP
jgi:hypothetical protein